MYLYRSFFEASGVPISLFARPSINIRRIRPDGVGEDRTVLGADAVVGHFQKVELRGDLEQWQFHGGNSTRSGTDLDYRHHSQERREPVVTRRRP